MADIYFKKDNGSIFKFYKHSHDLDSCKTRFTECDVNGKTMAKKKSKQGDK